MADPEPFSPAHLRQVARRIRELDDRIDGFRMDCDNSDWIAAVDPLAMQRRDDLDAAATFLGMIADQEDGRGGA